MQEAKIVKGADGKLRLENFYTPLSVAKKEIWKRWNDKELRKKVEDFLGLYIPDFLKTEPRALLVRQITASDIEYYHFIEQAKSIGLKPTFVEYLTDKFATNNPDKYHLGKLYFFEGQGKNHGDKIRVMRIVDFNKNEGKKLSEVTTVWGESLVDFHHKILSLSHPEDKKNIFEISDWININGGSAKKIYKKYFTWFICHGILFENFLLNHDEFEFTEKVVLPSIKVIQQKFGINPLIVPVIPLREENNLYWWCFPKNIRNIVQKNWDCSKL
jgi:hypothetical protein